MHPPSTDEASPGCVHRSTHIINQESHMPEPNEQKGDTQKPEQADSLVETHHSITIEGREIRYTVTTGTIILKEEREDNGEKSGASKGEQPKASIFFIAYTRNDGSDAATRPLTFSFNGGPGSSSVWLHLGLFGPRRVVLDNDGHPLQPPYRLTDNEYSLLDTTDLVFIDPVSTGYSRPALGERAKEFHGFTKDIESVGDFIRLYTTRYGRWGSPKFLAGESYGTTRAAGLSGYLQDRHGLYLNGIMLISSVLDFQTLAVTPGNDLPHVLYLPTYTATAWYHGCLAPKLQNDLHATLREATEFAMGPYTLALMQGASIDAKERSRTAAALARYTGLSLEYIERCNLRIDMSRFTKELLRAQGRTVGRLDARFTGIDRNQVGDRPEYDPSLTDISGPYTATINDYMRRELKFESDLPYEILNPKVWPWSYAEFENSFVNVAETLRRAMTINPHLKVYVASGYYDLATPYLATDYTMSHLGLDASLGQNISTKYYEAGHMMYIHLPSLAQMKTDLADFLRAAAG